MCGIAGIINFNQLEDKQPLLRRMIGLLRHRGPDAAGIYENGPIGLGHARLSIIGLEGGGQPISNEDGSLWIVYNGEVFNYVELREDLIRKGHVYPAYYAPREDIGGLPWDLREQLTLLSDNAWMNYWGVWEFDESRANPRIRNMDELTELAIWPKLYRRLALYFLDGNDGLANFEQWLTDNNKDDRVLIMSRDEYTHLHNTFDINDNRINMRYWPEDIIVYPG